jgi:hypothetical protein
MGIADRDYMRDRHRSRNRFAPSQPAARSTLWTILIFVSLAYAGYKLREWWVIKEQVRAAAAERLQAPRPPVQPRARADLTGNWDPARSVDNLPPRSESTSTVRVILKCVVNGVTLYAESEADCVAQAQRTRIKIDSQQNLSAAVPSAQAVALPPPMRQQTTTQTPLPAPPQPDTQSQFQPQAAPDSNVNKQAICGAYEAEIKRIDARARQPLSANEQDWWTAKRRKVRDEEFRLRC